MTISGMPGVQTVRTATPRRLRKSDQGAMWLPAGEVISGAASRDPGNTGDLDVLRAGTPMGKITTGGKWAPSIIGTLGDAIVGTATQMNMYTAAQAAEVSRRLGTTGTLKLTGPQVAGGRVRTQTITYSAVGAGSGVNEVQTLTPDAASSAGTYRIKLQKPDGSAVWTAAIAYDATLAACQAAITLALGAVAGWVASTAGSAAPFSAGPIALVLTASGTGYTAHDYPMCEVEITSLTGVTTMTGVQTTRGVPVAATLTITAPGLAAVNAVHTWTPNAAWTAGTMRFGFIKPDTGELVWLTFTYTTDLATTLAAINVILDAAFGASSIVATGGGNITSLIFTYSGGIYAGRDHPLPLVDYTGATGAASTTTFIAAPDGVSSGFAVGSFIQPVDGSETPLTLIDDGYGMKVTDQDAVSQDQPFPKPLIGGILDSSQIINWPTDASLIAWLKDKLNNASAAHFVFDDIF